MSESPTELYCRWFEALTPAVADELAVALIQLFPGGALESPLVTGRPTDGFTARLRRLAATPSSGAAAPVRVSSRDAGTALSLATLTDFVFFEQTDPASWKRSEAMIEVLERAQEEMGAPVVGEEISSWIAQNKLRGPLRARQWVKESESWRVLRNKELATSKIREELRAAMVEALKPKT